MIRAVAKQLACSTVADARRSRACYLVLPTVFPGHSDQRC